MGESVGWARYLKEKNKNIKIVMPDPVSSVYYGYFKNGVINLNDIKPYVIEGVGKEKICECMDFSLVGEVIQFTDEDVKSTLKALVKKQGILAGGSSEAALFVAKKIAKRGGPEINIVTIFPDSGEKYLSTIYS